MDKMIGSISAASSLQVTDLIPELDAASKEIFSNKEFLAIILKYTVREYSDLSFTEIAACIEPDSIYIKDTEASSGRTNIDSNRIRGGNTEFPVLNEMLSRFDILIKAKNPKLSNGNTVYCLHVDLEEQNDYMPGYPVEKRGIFYASRMIGSQVHAPTAKANYQRLEKVYTIWICKNRIPERLQNTMSVYEIMNTYNTWGTQEALAAQREDYDLISMVILRLGKPEYENVDDVFRILNALLYQRTEKAYDVIKEYVDFSDALNREVENMFSFGKMIHEDGKEVGRQEVMRSMCENGFSLDVIAKIMKLPLEQVQEILQSSMIPMR